jgi:hypothetical protein
LADETDILIILGLGYFAYTRIVKPIKKTVQPYYEHVTGETHREEEIYRVMGGPQGFKGSSITWPRFFPAILDWGKLLG